MSKKRRAIIIASPDGFANGVKPKKLNDYLTSNGYYVDVYSTKTVTRLRESGLLSAIPGLRPAQLRIFMLGVIYEFCARLSWTPLKHLIPFVIASIIKQRGRYLAKKLAGMHYDLLICESSFDEGIFLYDRIAAKQVLDLPAPFAEELYYGAYFSQKGLKHLADLERTIYRNADYLSFHWHTYAEYVKQHKYNGDNFIDLDYGTDPKAKTAKLADSPRIVFLGYLKGYWVNLPLLSELCQAFPNLDVYGGPKPPAHYGINYKGYAPSKDVLAEYQYGLITISDDPLRQQSFSSKHLEYLSYGLPVLAPSWRHDTLLDGPTIYFSDAEDLKKQVAKIETNNDWQYLSERAIAVANKLNWGRALTALDKVLSDLESRT